MLVKTHGFVLHTLKYSETSIISRIFTRELGLQSYMINGVRSTKGNKAALFRPGNILELVSYFKREHKGLQRLKEFNFGVIYQQLPFHIIKSSLALFIIEVLNKVLTEEDPNPELYDFIESSFTELDNTNVDLGSFHLKFLGMLAMQLGFHPGGKFDPNTPYFDLIEGLSSAVPPSHTFYLMPRQTTFFFNEQLNNPLDIAERRALLEKLLYYYNLHVDHFGETRSWEILREVLAAASRPKQ
jgi:DNA repair protein RecO (recombination protein O)